MTRRLLRHARIKNVQQPRADFMRLGEQQQIRADVGQAVLHEFNVRRLLRHMTFARDCIIRRHLTQMFPVSSIHHVYLSKICLFLLKHKHSNKKSHDKMRESNRLKTDNLLGILHAQQRSTRLVVSRTRRTDAEGAYAIFKGTDRHALTFAHSAI